jgi:integrase
MDSDGTGPVFRNRDGKRRHPRLTFHSLRHSRISRLANHPEIPLVYVRDFAGHTNLATTERYVHRIESQSATQAAAAAMSCR